MVSGESGRAPMHGRGKELRTSVLSALRLQLPQPPCPATSFACMRCVRKKHEALPGLPGALIPASVAGWPWRPRLTELSQLVPPQSDAQLPPASKMRRQGCQEALLRLVRLVCFDSSRASRSVRKLILPAALD